MEYGKLSWWPAALGSEVELWKELMGGVQENFCSLFLTVLLSFQPSPSIEFFCRVFLKWWLLHWRAEGEEKG